MSDILCDSLPSLRLSHSNSSGVFCSCPPLIFFYFWRYSLFTLYLLSTIQLYFIFQVLADKLLFVRLLSSHGDLEFTVTTPRWGYIPCNAPPSLRHPLCSMVTQTTILTSQSTAILLDQQLWKYFKKKSRLFTAVTPKYKDKASKASN